MADPRKLKDEAAEAATTARYRRAAELYEQIARLEPGDPQWSHRAGESWKRVGDRPAAITRLTTAAEGYARSGFLLKAISVAKMVLELDPGRTEIQAMLASLYARHDATPSKPPAQAPRAPSSGGPSAPSLRAGGGRAPIEISLPSTPPPELAARPQRPSPPLARKSPTAPPLPPPVAPRTTAPPLTYAPPPGFEVDIDPSDLVPLDHVRPQNPPPTPPAVRSATPQISMPPLRERVPGSHISEDFAISAYEIPLHQNTPVPTPARAKGLPHIPLFSSLDEERLRRLIQGSRVIHCEPGHVVVRQGDTGNALFVVVQGLVSVRVEGVEDPVAHLVEGEFFGELALLSDQPRLATVEAVGEAEVMEIGRALIWELIDEAPDVLRILLRFFRDRLIDRLIQTSPLFSTFSGPESLELAERFHFLELKAGAELVREGQRAEGLFVVLLGQCDVVTFAAGKVAELGPGELAGEMSLLTHAPASATVVATTALWVLGLPRARFQELILTHPQVLIYVNEVAEQRRATNSQAVRLV